MDLPYWYDQYFIDWHDTHGLGEANNYIERQITDFVAAWLYWH